MHIIYQDNHLFVVEKPVNVPVQEDASGDLDLLTMGKAFIKEQDHKPGNVYLGLVHRLDRPVGGVIVFAKTSKAASRLSDQLRRRAIKRQYIVVCQGHPKQQEASLTDYMYKDRRENMSYIDDAKHPEGKKAKLHYKVLETKGSLSLLQVELETGRSHQIRVQLAHAGLPIYGDQRYNPQAVVGEQIALLAYGLTLEHPTLKEEMTFTALPDERDPWDTFKLSDIMKGK